MLRHYYTIKEKKKKTCPRRFNQNMVKPRTKTRVCAQLPHLTLSDLALCFSVVLSCCTQKESLENLPLQLGHCARGLNDKNSSEK